VPGSVEAFSVKPLGQLGVIDGHFRFTERLCQLPTGTKLLPSWLVRTQSFALIPAN
jgi:hypothetical protein